MFGGNFNLILKFKKTFSLEPLEFGSGAFRRKPSNPYTNDNNFEDSGSSKKILHAVIPAYDFSARSSSLRKNPLREIDWYSSLSHDKESFFKLIDPKVDSTYSVFASLANSILSLKLDSFNLPNRFSNEDLLLLAKYLSELELSFNENKISKRELFAKFLSKIEDVIKHSLGENPRDFYLEYALSELGASEIILATESLAIENADLISEHGISSSRISFLKKLIADDVSAIDCEAIEKLKAKSQIILKEMEDLIKRHKVAQTAYFKDPSDKDIIANYKLLEEELKSTKLFTNSLDIDDEIDALSKSPKEKELASLIKQHEYTEHEYSKYLERRDELIEACKLKVLLWDEDTLDYSLGKANYTKLYIAIAKASMLRKFGLGFDL